jgi:Tol biopolymer transport system component
MIWRTRIKNKFFKMNFKSRKLIPTVLLSIILATAACQQPDATKQIVRPSSLRDVPAQRLSYRYEPDVPAPPDAVQINQQQKLTAIQADFDQTRTQDTLYKTILSPDKQRVLAIFNRATDEKQEYRMDLYDASGKLIRKITPEGLSLVFPDIVSWSPNSETVAFTGSRRVSTQSQEIVQEAPPPPSLEDENQNAPPTGSPAATTASPLPNAPVMTFRTEQIYLASREGADLKPLTQKEGLIYFYFAWSPDGAMLAALAAKENEWQAMETQAASRGELLRPLGRPRLLEKNGRERLLDDNLSDVHPVFSPDSSKAAIAYRTDVRIYDAVGNQPSSAAIPLQVQLLTSSQAYDDKQKGQTAPANSAPVTTLPSAQPPASFNPIVALRWSQDDALYLQTGYVKDFASGELVRSFMRWHKLNLSPQGAVLN